MYSWCVLEGADAFRAVGKCFETLRKSSCPRGSVTHTHTRVALGRGPPARQGAREAPRPSRSAARGRPPRPMAHALSRPFRRGAQARCAAAHARGAGWRRPRGINMEDEEVAESWEEAADSGVRAAARSGGGRREGWCRRSVRRRGSCGGARQARSAC